MKKDNSGKEATGTYRPEKEAFEKDNSGQETFETEQI